MTDDCQACQDDLPLLLTGDHDAAAAARLEAHLATCAECRDERDAMAATLDGLRAAGAARDPSPPLERLTVETLSERAALGRARAPRPWLKAAALLLAFGAGVLFDRAWLTPAPAPVAQVAPTPPEGVAPTPAPATPALVEAYRAAEGQASTGLSRALLALSSGSR